MKIIQQQKCKTIHNVFNITCFCQRESQYIKTIRKHYKITTNKHLITYQHRTAIRNQATRYTNTHSLPWTMALSTLPALLVAHAPGCTCVVVSFRHLQTICNAFFRHQSVANITCCTQIELY